MDGESLTQAEYAALVKSLPPPALDQKYAFAEAVGHAHSWYKHLRPSAAFSQDCYFYLDPSAGMVVNVTGDRLSLTPRLKQGFHYNMIPTADYRERYGYLSCTAYSGRTFEILSDGPATRMVGSLDRPAVFDASKGLMRTLPTEALQQGATSFSGIVHAHCIVSKQWLQRGMAKEGVWPEETGGEALRKRVNELVSHRRPRSERMPDETLAEIISHTEYRYCKHNFFSYDLELLRLVQPERRRQHNNMVAAMDRVLLWAMMHD